MEKLKVTIARELCQLHGIEIYPVEMGWSTKIAMKQGDIEKVGEQDYLKYTTKINKKWAIGWEEKIDQMWLHKAAQIKKAIAKRQKANNERMQGGYGTQAAAILPLFSSNALTLGFGLALFSALLIGLICWLINNRKNR